jgi:hypothetical protein
VSIVKRPGSCARAKTTGSPSNGSTASQRVPTLVGIASSPIPRTAGTADGAAAAFGTGSSKLYVRSFRAFRRRPASSGSSRSIPIRR